MTRPSGGTVTHGEWQPDVEAFSPDRSVCLRADQAGQVQVMLADLHLHTDDSLAGQVRAATRVALAMLQDGRPGRAPRT